MISTSIFALREHQQVRLPVQHPQGQQQQQPLVAGQPERQHRVRLLQVVQLNHENGNGQEECTV